MGLVMPFTLRGKIIIQKCWTYTVEDKDKKRQGLEWDEELPLEPRVEVENWKADIPEVAKQKICKIHLS